MDLNGRRGEGRGWIVYVRVRCRPVGYWWAWVCRRRRPVWSTAILWPASPGGRGSAAGSSGRFCPPPPNLNWSDTNNHIIIIIISSQSHQHKQHTINSIHIIQLINIMIGADWLVNRRSVAPPSLESELGNSDWLVKCSVRFKVVVSFNYRNRNRSSLEMDWNHPKCADRSISDGTGRICPETIRCHRLNSWFNWINWIDLVQLNPSSI